MFGTKVLKLQLVDIDVVIEQLLPPLEPLKLHSHVLETVLLKILTYISCG